MVSTDKTADAHAELSQYIARVLLERSDWSLDALEHPVLRIEAHRKCIMNAHTTLSVFQYNLGRRLETQKATRAFHSHSQIPYKEIYADFGAP